MKFLVTGHTGFKGSWLVIWLKMQGHEVYGIALDPLPSDLFLVANLEKMVDRDLRSDIRDFEKLESFFQEVKPDVVIHLAAQAIVSESYKNPMATYETNVLGTLNVLKAIHSVKSSKANIIVTTDKVYFNNNMQKPYLESDSLGGRDPYSSSKAMADTLAQTWGKNFPELRIAIARAGNVIGGGDTSTDRLIPDLIAAFKSDTFPSLRYPKSIRPWQHVLDCLAGYLCLIEAMINSELGGEWNFGPTSGNFKTVEEVTLQAGLFWGISDQTWKVQREDVFPEATMLALDSTKAKTLLGWEGKLNFENSIKFTIDWYKQVHNGGDPLNVTRKQIETFLSV